MGDFPQRLEHQIILLDHIGRHAGCQMGSSSKPAVKSCQVYPLSDLYLKEAYPPPLQLQNLIINAFYASFHRQTISPVHQCLSAIRQRTPSCFLKHTPSDYYEMHWHDKHLSLKSRIQSVCGGKEVCTRGIELQRSSYNKPVCSSRPVTIVKNFVFEMSSCLLLS
jgi:hypothetical protein